MPPRSGATVRVLQCKIDKTKRGQPYMYEIQWSSTDETKWLSFRDVVDKWDIDWLCNVHASFPKWPQHSKIKEHMRRSARRIGGGHEGGDGGEEEEEEEEGDGEEDGDSEIDTALVVFNSGAGSAHRGQEEDHQHNAFTDASLHVPLTPSFAYQSHFQNSDNDDDDDGEDGQERSIFSLDDNHDATPSLLFSTGTSWPSQSQPRERHQANEAPMTSFFSRLWGDQSRGFARAASVEECRDPTAAVAHGGSSSSSFDSSHAGLINSPTTSTTTTTTPGAYIDSGDRSSNSISPTRRHVNLNVPRQQRGHNTPTTSTTTASTTATTPAAHVGSGGGISESSSPKRCINLNAPRQQRGPWSSQHGDGDRTLPPGLLNSSSWTRLPLRFSDGSDAVGADDTAAATATSSRLPSLGLLSPSPSGPLPPTLLFSDLNGAGSSAGVGTAAAGLQQDTEAIGEDMLGEFQARLANDPRFRGI